MCNLFGINLGWWAPQKHKESHNRELIAPLTTPCLAVYSEHYPSGDFTASILALREAETLGVWCGATQRQGRARKMMALMSAGLLTCFMPGGWCDRTHWEKAELGCRCPQPPEACILLRTRKTPELVVQV